jgi:T4-like virus tail tube protein gp19
MPSVQRQASNTVIELSGKPIASSPANRMRLQSSLPVTANAATLRRSLAAVNPILVGEVQFEFRLAESAEMLDWLQALMKRDPVERDGALVAVDHNFKEKRRAAFSAGLITELKFDDLDAAAAREPVQFGLRVQPQSLVFQAGSGAAVALPKPKRKAWLASNFRVSIGGLPGERVSKVELPRVNCTVAEKVDGPAASRRRLQSLGTVEIGALGLRFGSAARDVLLAHANDWAAGKLDSVPAEVVVELLDTALKTVLARWRFTGCTLLAVQDEADDRMQATSPLHLSLQPATMALELPG